MQCTKVFSIELNDQDLAGLHDSGIAMQAATQRKPTTVAPENDYDLIEIELTPQEIDELLGSDQAG